MLLTGKTAIVTGGSRGIGRAVSLLLAREGANVAIVYAGNTAAAEETKQQAEALGAAAAVFQCDVADEQAVTDMVKAVKTQFGSVDILVNNAGITRDGLLMRMKEADWQAVLDTNLTGVYHCTKAVSKLMMKQRHGAVINLSSVVGETGNAGQANYAAAKAGIIGFTKAVAKELASRNIRVNAVAPGYVETDMTAGLPDSAKEDMLRSIPLGRPATADDVAQAVLFLASDQACYITGQVLNVDGAAAQGGIHNTISTLKGGESEMSEEATFEKVKSIVVEQLGVDEKEVKMDAAYIDDLGADSLDIVELIMAFEEEFNIEIPDDVAEKIKTVKDTVDYIEKEKKA